MSTPFERSRRVMEILRGYREASVLITFAQLGLGDILRAGPLSAGEVAERAGTEPSATARLLDAAVAVGLVDHDSGRYRNTPLAADVLTSDGPASLFHFASREAAFYRRWALLTEAVRSGQRPEANVRDEDDPNWVRDFTYALYDTARIAESGITAALSPIIESFGRPVRLIDVGGGHGGYSIGLARRFPDLRAVVFDLPPVIAITREIIRKTGMADRVTTIAGNFHEDPLGTGYDVALLFGVLVGEDPEGSIRLLRTVRQALRPGGYLVIRSHHAARGVSRTLDSALFDLQMLLSTRGGGAHGREDTAGWLRKAGLEPLDPIEIPEPATGMLLPARVPELEG